MAACALADALAARREFWDHVDAVHAATNPERAAKRLSLRYCQGERRAMIAELLVRGALAPQLRDASQDAQRDGLLGAGSRPPSGDAVDDPLPTSLLFASHVVAARAGRAGARRRLIVCLVMVTRRGH